MKIGIISGSTRAVSQSFKVATYVRDYLEKTLGHATYTLNLATDNIKYWDETFWSNYKGFDANWSVASGELRECDAIVVIAPEWNGMVPSALKNIFQLATKGEFANKPALIISVSSGLNGVYPIAELRLNTYKNTHLCYIPQHVIVRNVNNVLNEAESEVEEDKLTRERIQHSLKVLAVYGEAFGQIRTADAIINNPYPYGM